jgi:tRNA dimethylallyltransferase
MVFFVFMIPPFQNALVLTGPTGSGKSRLGIELAERLGAEIVSMDSMALYRRMDIGTAKSSLADRARVPHHLLDVLDPWESASVAWWLRRAAECCSAIEGRGKRVLFVGGTALYLKALLFGIFEGPPADVQLRRRWAEFAEEHGNDRLHARLAKVDPGTAARLHINDTKRIIRALEVWELTGQPISASQTQWSATTLPDDRVPRVLWLDLPRSELYRRINQRTDAMFAAGLVEEVRQVRALPRPMSREARQALGYKELFDYLDGRCDLEAAAERIRTRSRNYAKRQVTWFRRLPGCRSATEELTFALWISTINN